MQPHHGELVLEEDGHSFLVKGEQEGAAAVARFGKSSGLIC